jgi:probable HAF family extracellular repeat protein
MRYVTGSLAAVTALGLCAARPAFCQSYTIRELVGLGVEPPGGMAINKAGQVVGHAQAPNDSPPIVLWDKENLFDLSIPGSRWGFVADIGQVVGSVPTVVGVSSTADSSGHAYLWEGGKIRDINDLIPAGSGWELGSAWSINDQGQIVGTGSYNGQKRAFLLTPVAPTASAR